MTVARYVVEVPAPPAEGNSIGEGRARDNLRTAIDAMEVVTEDMVEGDEVTAEEDGAEAEGVRVGG